MCVYFSLCINHLFLFFFLFMPTRISLFVFVSLFVVLIEVALPVSSIDYLGGGGPEFLRCQRLRIPCRWISQRHQHSYEAAHLRHLSLRLHPESLHLRQLLPQALQQPKSVILQFLLILLGHSVTQSLTHSLTHSHVTQVVW